MAKTKSISNAGGKKNGKTGAKRGSKRPKPFSIYRAWFGGRAKVSPAKKYGRDTRKASSFTKIVSLVRVQQDTTRTALERMASATCAVNMCKRHEIKMTDILEQIEFSKNKYQGSSSSVIIRHSNKVKKTTVRIQSFLIDLCDAIEMMFQCDAYTELQNGVLRVTFYGIASNTISAQIAFKTCYNQIAELGLTYKGVAQRNSFLLGMAAGFWNRALHRKLAFEGDLQRAKELAATTFAKEDFEVDEDYEPDFNFDAKPREEEAIDKDKDEKQTIIKNEVADDDSMASVVVGSENTKAENDKGGKSEKNDNENDDEDSEGEDDSEGSYNWVQCILAHHEYRDKVEQAAAGWLKDNGVKLRSLRRYRRNILCPEEFAQGEEDSNDIDLGEKRIDMYLQQDLAGDPAEEEDEDNEASA